MYTTSVLAANGARRLPSATRTLECAGPNSLHDFVVRLERNGEGGWSGHASNSVFVSVSLPLGLSLLFHIDILLILSFTSRPEGVDGLRMCSWEKKR